MEPDSFLEEGKRILSPKLEPLGYRFELIRRPVQGSGGPFAIAAFRRGDRSVRMWARFENLRVDYVVGDVEFTHTDHMRALGFKDSAQFPGSMKATLSMRSADCYVTWSIAPSSWLAMLKQSLNGFGRFRPRKQASQPSAPSVSFPPKAAVELPRWQAQRARHVAQWNREKEIAVSRA